MQIGPIETKCDYVRQIINSIGIEWLFIKQWVGEDMCVGVWVGCL